MAAPRPARPDPFEVLAAALRGNGSAGDDAARNGLIPYIRAHQPAFEDPPHIQTMVAELEAVERGDTKRLMIFIPPRHGKSETTTRYFPAWLMGKHPDRGVISASYSQDLSDDFGRRVRNLVSSDVHERIFPDCRISPDSSAARRFNTTAMGTYYAVGRGASITGRGAHYLIIDDPIKDRAEADSEMVRRTLKSWYSEVAYTRLQPDGAVVLVQTRWNPDDLAGWLLEEHGDEKWKVLSLPAIAEEDEPFRKTGQALWPARFNEVDLQRIRAQIGSAAFTSLYQQRPSASEGVIFKRRWLAGRYADLPKLIRVIQVWDTAFKAGAENDYSACTTWGETATHFLLLDAWRGRIEFPGLIAKARELAGTWGPSAVLIEDKASGQSLIQTLRTSTSLPVLAIKVGSDKVSRANAVSPSVEAGKVLLPVNAPWLDEYLNELCSFPNVKHDDWTDTTTMALEYLNRGRGFVVDENEPAVIFQQRRAQWL